MGLHLFPQLTTTALRSETDLPIEWFAQPSPILKPYIRAYHGLIMPKRLLVPFTRLVIPSAMTALYIAFGAQSTTQVMLPGTEMTEEIQRPNSSFILPTPRQWGVQIPASADVVSVVFRLGMVTPFLDLSLREFSDSWIAPSELWTHAISNRLADIEAFSPVARVAAIESVLIDRLQKSRFAVDPLIQYAVDSMEQTQGNMALNALTETLGISARQLRRRFQAHMGMSPKLFGRLERFHYATEFACQHYPQVSLATVAHKFGYFDQSHFAKDVIEFTGQTPKALALSDQQAEQVPEEGLDFFAFAADPNFS